MNVENIIAAITPVISALEQLGIEYYLGGSVVSSTYGIPRATFDVDLVANLQQQHVRSFVRKLGEEYYADEV
jgi:hypothetical protein